MEDVWHLSAAISMYRQVISPQTLECCVISVCILGQNFLATLSWNLAHFVKGGFVVLELCDVHGSSSPLISAGPSATIGKSEQGERRFRCTLA